MTQKNFSNFQKDLGYSEVNSADFKQVVSRFYQTTDGIDEDAMFKEYEIDNIPSRLGVPIHFSFKTYKYISDSVEITEEYVCDSTFQTGSRTYYVFYKERLCDLRKLYYNLLLNYMERNKRICNYFKDRYLEKANKLHFETDGFFQTLGDAVKPSNITSMTVDLNSRKVVYKNVVYYTKMCCCLNKAIEDYLKNNAGKSKVILIIVDKNFEEEIQILELKDLFCLESLLSDIENNYKNDLSKMIPEFNNLIKKYERSLCKRNLNDNDKKVRLSYLFSRVGNFLSKYEPELSMKKEYECFFYSLERQWLNRRFLENKFVKLMNECPFFEYKIYEYYLISDSRKETIIYLDKKQFLKFYKDIKNESRRLIGNIFKSHLFRPLKDEQKKIVSKQLFNSLLQEETVFREEEVKKFDAEKRNCYRILQEDIVNVVYNIISVIDDVSVDIATPSLGFISDALRNTIYTVKKEKEEMKEVKKEVKKVVKKEVNESSSSSSSSHSGKESINTSMLCKNVAESCVTKELIKSVCDLAPDLLEYYHLKKITQEMDYKDYSLKRQKDSNYNLINMLKFLDEADRISENIFIISHGFLITENKEYEVVMSEDNVMELNRYLRTYNIEVFYEMNVH